MSAVADVQSGIEAAETTEIIPVVEEVQPEAKADESEEKPEEKAEQKENHDFRRMKKFIERAAKAEAKAEMLERQLAQKTAQQIVDEKPKRDQFQSDEDFIEALTDYKVNQKIPEIQKAARVNDNGAVALQRQEAEFRKATPDYDEVMADANEMAIPDNLQAALGDAIVSSEYFAAIKYHLAKNPDEFDRIVKMSPVAAVKEIGKIEAQLSSGKAPVKKSAAPAPIKPPKGGTPSAKDINSPDLPIGDFMKLRAQQLKNKT